MDHQPMISPGMLSQVGDPDVTARILNAGLMAADPYKAVQRNVHVNRDCLVVGDCVFDLHQYDRIILTGVGKAVFTMAEGILDLLGERITTGFLIGKHLQPGRWKWGNIQRVIGSHPVPDERSVRAGKGMQQFLCGLTSRDLVISLISGGGSALMMALAPGIQLEDIQSLTRQMLTAGANIIELNTIRKQFDLIKDGGMIRASLPATMIALIMSDVVGDRRDMIASGPTVLGAKHPEEAVEILHQYGIWAHMPENMKEYLNLKMHEYSLSEDIHISQHMPYNFIVASNRQSVHVAANQAELEGFHVEILTTEMQGEARDVGETLATRFLHAVRDSNLKNRPLLWVAGGETTVTVSGSGTGGRNQELALAGVQVLTGMDNISLISLATDGEDGPTNAAGAVVTGNTYQVGAQKGLFPDHFLSDNNSHEYFNQVNSLLITGPTGTNVNDLCFLFAYA